jgi:hypothetical protein
MKQIVDKFKIGKTQVYDILKSKSDIKREWLTGNGSMKRKLKKTGNEDINEIVWDWFISARAKKFSVSGPMLQQKWLIHKEKLTLGHLTDGWKVSGKDMVVFSSVCRESADVCEETVAEWSEKLCALMDGYEVKDIANCINSNNTENLQEALNRANFGNIMAEDYVKTEADLNNINQFIEDNQQAEAQDQELESEEESPIAESSVKTYSDAIKHLKDLENFALTRNDSDLFETIFRARRMTENHAYKLTGYIQKTLFNYWKK